MILNPISLSTLCNGAPIWPLTKWPTQGEINGEEGKWGGGYILKKKISENIEDRQEFINWSRFN